MSVKNNRSEDTEVYNMHLIKHCKSYITPLTEFISANNTNKDNFLNVS